LPDGESGGGFRSDTLDTGWFHIVGDSPANIDLLNDIYNSLVPTGEMTLQLKDDDTYPIDGSKNSGLPDNNFDFTRGVEGDLPPPVMAVSLPAADESDINESGESVSGSFAFNYGADGPWDGNPVDGPEGQPGKEESPLTLSLKVVDP